MRIAKITARHRNDFHFEAYCGYCGKTSRWGDGYADAYYQQVVFPHRHCPDCGLDEFGSPRHAQAPINGQSALAVSQ